MGASTLATIFSNFLKSLASKLSRDNWASLSYSFSQAPPFFYFNLPFFEKTTSFILLIAPAALFGVEAAVV